MPGICWYPAKCTGHAVNQGGTADKLLFVLDRCQYTVKGDFFMYKSAPCGDADVKLACKDASTFGATSEIEHVARSAKVRDYAGGLRKAAKQGEQSGLIQQ